MTQESETLDEVNRAIARLEVELGLPQGFLENLATEDDWSFVIKCHAILEATLVSVLTRYLANDALAGPLAYLEMGHPQYGKVELTKALELTTSDERRFIAELTKLRNRCAHRVESIAFDFGLYIECLDANQRAAFAKAIGYFYLRENADGNLEVSNPDRVLGEPKATILAGLKAFLAIATVQAETAVLRQERIQLIEKMEDLRRSGSE